LTHVPSFFALVFFSENIPPLFITDDSSEIVKWHLGIIFICVYLTLSQFSNHNHKYESRISQLLQVQKETNLVLENQKEQIEAQAFALQRSNLILQKEINEKELTQQKLIASNEELEQYAVGGNIGILLELFIGGY
jgi:C4-dicarboxylate-specific signal transduction histidine kinase